VTTTRIGGGGCTIAGANIIDICGAGSEAGPCAYKAARQMTSVL